jgi:hypothetical protein
LSESSALLRAKKGGSFVNAIRFITFALLAGTLTACAGRSAIPPPSPPSASPLALSDLLRPYEVSARKVRAAAPPVVGEMFDLTRSVDVPADLGRQAFGPAGDAARSASDMLAQQYAMVAASPAPKATAKQRAVRDGETCYWLVTYLYNVRTGEIVRILGVQFQGCDGGAPADGGGGGGGGDPPPAPPNLGCQNNKEGTAGKAYADIGASNPIFGNPDPNSSAPKGQEMYGYVYGNGSGAFRYDPPTTVTIVNGHDASIGQPNEYPGWFPVGLYHTHPHDPTSETNQIDQDTHTHFSQQDINTAIAQNYPIYVAVLDTIAQNDSSEVAQTRWYKYDPATGQETTMNTVGAGGC